MSASREKFEAWQAAEQFRQAEIDAFKQSLMAAQNSDQHNFDRWQLVLAENAALKQRIADAELQGRIEYLTSYSEAQKESFDEIAQSNIELQQKLAASEADVKYLCDTLEYIEGFVAETDHTELCAKHCEDDHDWSNCKCGKTYALKMAKFALEAVRTRKERQ